MKNTVLKFNDYDVSALDFETPEFNNSKKQIQTIKLPIYEGGRSPLIQLPKMELDMYGIPSKSDYYKDDYQRMFLKLPLNQTLPAVKGLTEWLNQIDSKFGTPKAREQLFGKKGSKHLYQPLVRIPVGEEGKPNQDKHPYLKLKLTTKFPTNEITTQIFNQKEDGKRASLEKVNDVDEFAQFVRFKSKIKCMIQPSKLWMTNVSTSEPMYGIMFKLVQVMVFEQPNTHFNGQISFISSDDEEDESKSDE